MTVATAWKRQTATRGYRGVFIKMTYGNADTSVVVNTGLKKIYSYSVSPTSVATKTVTAGAVSGGTITLTVTDPLAACYLTVTAWGI
jgi:hypothetical protein